MEQKLFEELETAEAQMTEALAPKPATKELPLYEVSEDTTTARDAKKETTRISRAAAHQLMDRIAVGTLDESIALQRWIKQLSPEERQQEADAFLSRHEVNDKLFLLNGYHMLKIYGKMDFQEVHNTIMAMRPNGKNTYCYVCDTCHYTDPCERYKRMYGLDTNNE